MQNIFIPFLSIGMKLLNFISFIVFILMFSACNTNKFVPEGEFLLDKINIKSDNKELNHSDLKEYLRQTPNAAVFGAFRMQLGIYDWAPKDTTKWLNRILHKTFFRIGDPPVIYNSALTSLSVQQLQLLLENKGYINAKVASNVITKGKKATVVYIINSNTPYRLNQYNIDINNEALNKIASDTSKSLIKPNILFDADIFNAERERIASRFRQQGYYNFNKEFLAYSADSSLNSHKINMTLKLRDYLKKSNDSTENLIFKQFTIGKVTFYANTDENLLGNLENKIEYDTIKFRDFELISPKKRILKLDALVQNTYINPNSLYSDDAVERTYSALNSLGPIKYVNISFKENKNNILEIGRAHV